ncbi:carboxymethylenebutenolidase [Sphingomonas sp. Leaf231]|uniref:dienelactone hydrolase family protein n=1 Tax=Sphingomonas sp. Leaf231 TaxID=1736301 RepID=UPI0006FF5776|nr:dienelactone hydrolase family protein [Sphingomonas sp. Leaf231]KQN90519.1 carboxymethylenebutenolidase [Sphingomonas sp. Leaf231]
MTIRRRPLVHDGPGGAFEGVFAWDDALAGARPAVLVIPNVLGQKEADNRKAEELAALGYAAFACDLFGQGRRTTRGPGASLYMDELDADRGLLRERLRATLDAFATQAEVDEARMAAIGFCFGGKCVLDMARAGMAIRGGVSLHGVYDRPVGQSVAPIAAALLICHGWDDPLGPPNALVALGRELTEAGADWQVHAYARAGHGFTDRSLTNAAPGFGYNAPADRRSDVATHLFLQEVLGK